ncbi:acyl-CoA dehydrogenase family protein [Cupriavidus basilensis]
MQLTPEHEALRATIKRFIAEQINPYVDAWEEAEIFPAHEVFRKMGELGLLGLSKPEEDGGHGPRLLLSAVLAETLSDINCGGVPMAIGVQTDMATPALCPPRQRGELRREFLSARDPRRVRGLPGRLGGG